MYDKKCGLDLDLCRPDLSAAVAQKNAPCSVARGRLCIAVPPRFAVPSREAALSGTEGAVLCRGVDTLPLITGGSPACPYSKRDFLRISFRRRLVARIRGCSRLPCTIRQFSFGTDPAHKLCAFPLLLRSHSLFYSIIMQYKIIDNILSSENAGFSRDIAKCRSCQPWQNTINHGRHQQILGNLAPFWNFMWRKVHEMFFALLRRGLYNSCVILDGLCSKNDSRFRMEEVDRWYAKNAARIMQRT